MLGMDLDGVLVPSILSSGTRGGSRRHSLYYAMFEKRRIEGQLETIPPFSENAYFYFNLWLADNLSDHKISA